MSRDPQSSFHETLIKDRRTHDTLAKELRRLRQTGLADPRERFHEYELLGHIARVLSKENTVREQLKDAIEQAASLVGQVYGPSVLALLGITDDAWGTDRKRRLRLAYEIFCAAEQAALVPGQEPRPVVFDTFRTHIAPLMIGQLARQLIVLYKANLRTVQAKKTGQAGHS